MKHLLSKRRTCYLIALMALVAACSTTAKPIAEWRDRTYAGDPFDNLLIVGISDKTTARRAFENAFVDLLEVEKVKSTAGFAVMPDQARPTGEKIRAVINDIHFDAVLVSHLVGVEEKKVYHPPSYRPSPHHNRFYGYYGHVGGYVYRPGYYSRHQAVRLETNLYDTQSELLVWSMQTETMNPGSEHKLIEGKIKTVVKHLMAQGLLRVN